MTTTDAQNNLPCLASPSNPPPFPSQIRHQFTHLEGPTHKRYARHSQPVVLAIALDNPDFARRDAAAAEATVPHGLMLRGPEKEEGGWRCVSGETLSLLDLDDAVLLSPVCL